MARPYRKKHNRLTIKEFVEAISNKKTLKENKMDREKRLPEHFKEAVKRLGISRWNVWNCSMCGYECGFVFRNDDSVFYDPGCGCVTHNVPLEPRTWEDVANFYNIQKNENIIAKMDALWRFVDPIHRGKEGS